MADVSDVFVAGDYAYTTSITSNNLVITNVSSPTAPAVASWLVDDTNLNGAYRVQVIGKYAYVINSADNSLRIIELSGIMSPTADIGALSSGTITVSGDAQIAGNISTDTLHINSDTFSDGKISVFGNDIKIYGNKPRPYSGFSDAACEAIQGVDACALGGANDMAIKGDVGFVAGKNDNGLQLLDLQNLRVPSYLSTVDTVLDSVPLNGVNALDVEDDILLAVSSTDNNLAIFNIMEEYSPIFLSSISDAQCEQLIGTGACMLENPTDVQAYGIYAFVTSETDGGIQVLDISDRQNIQYVTTIAITGGAYKEAIVGDKLFAVSRLGSSVTVVDISDPRNPVIEDTLVDDDTKSLGGASDITVVKGRAFITAEEEDALNIVDIHGLTLDYKGSINDTDCDSEVGGDGCSLDGANSVFSDGTIVYVTAKNDNGIASIDVSDSASPSHISSVFDSRDTFFQQPTSINIIGKNMYVTSAINYNYFSKKT